MSILQRPELATDPEQRTILKLTTLAGGLQDIWQHLMRANPAVLERPLLSRPDDPRTVADLIMARMDAMGESCEAYLDRTIDADQFKRQVTEHVKTTRGLAAEIKDTDTRTRPA
jgi:hypothetical protein